MGINYITMRFDPIDGYGLWAIEQFTQLSLMNADVKPIEYGTAENSTVCHPSALKTAFGFTPNSVNLQLFPSDKALKLDGININFSMWEDDTIPDGWAEAINANCEAFITTCNYYAERFADAGVSVPIHIVGGGINPATSLMHKRPERPFTFLCLADRGVRKGMEVAFNAFRRAFNGNEDVRLIIKTRKHGHDYKVLTNADARVSVIRDDFDSMSDLFALADCYVYPSYGDGWGLTPRQAVACGVPTIAPNHTGLQVGIENWATVILNDFERPKSHYGSNKARWFKPTIDETANAMRWVYDNQREAKFRAMKGREWLFSHQTWRHSAIALKHVLDAYTPEMKQLQSLRGWI